VSRADAEAMRAWLIYNGVELPIGDRDVKPANVAAETKPPEPDRRRIAEILADKARPQDLAWLTASCPSEHAAREYRRARIAWCVDCGGQTINDERGCQGCRARGATA